MNISQSLFSFIENRISPVAGKISSQRHIMAIRDGFIAAMPFMIVGSFLLVFVYPPFSAESSWGFARSWLALSGKYESQILTPFNMTMGIMSIYITAAIAYNLARRYQLDPFMTAMLALMGFLLVSAPQANGNMPTVALGGVGIFTAVIVAIYVTELTRFLKHHNIGIRLPPQVPANIKQSFDLLIPILAVIITLYPISMGVQALFDQLLPQAIMALFQPLISAADSLPAILLAVLICHLLWFAGIHGSAIVSGMLQAFWLTNLGLNQTDLAAGLPLTHIMTEAFWNFLIVIGGSGATFGLVLLFLRSKSVHLRAMGKLSLVPSMFNINEPVIFGTPIVMNPTFFIPFILSPMINAVVAYTAVTTNLLPHMISLVPWTSPAPIGAAWAMGWDFRVTVLVLLLMALSALIYYPFFKVYEKQLLAQERAKPAPEDDEAIVW
ncbi:cytochrome C biogenesis protein CcmF [Hafnia alvei FB1]|uniref:Permease IIC component n=1 Tax=Hafnia alvei FB1 TaxID=1453496 RepID=A0A097R8A0_HAFAL|nr:PTS sugar transporter subunit IIC [Hafnia alvei]AIU74976.1 cytochrome C biogenesis protein CcmF [Hafnia alvei FB1]KKF38737.1 cytochrome C biogenesis protein CcmF [Hafnia alvei]MBW3476351.1 PTS sugar transporter subunit IIC [Hafnia alvei]MDU3154619.1 PTS sugar transporter subunit IIC [Hafnia alvei]TBL42499.1 PTS sugar transporter subunit IIC [Hafnia alvei]